ncbi:Ankyrin-like protein [Globisporangium polare]
MSALAAVAVLTDPALLRHVVGFVRGIPFLLLELENLLEKDEWSAYYGDETLVARASIQREDHRALQMLSDVHRTLTLPMGSTMQVGAKMRFDNVLLWAVRIGNLSMLAWLREAFPHLKAGAQIMDVAIKAGRGDLLAFLEAHYAHDIAS